MAIELIAVYDVGGYDESKPNNNLLRYIEVQVPDASAGGAPVGNPQPYDPNPPAEDPMVQLMATVTSLYDTVLAESEANQELRAQNASMQEQLQVLSSRVQQMSSNNPLADVVGDQGADVDE